MAPATTTSATTHVPKPEGGTRPVALFTELLKRTEGLVAQRLTRLAEAAPLGSFLSGCNLAYTRGQSTDSIHGLIRVIMEADALANLGIIWLLGDYHKWFDIIRREVVQAKLDAMGAPPAVARLIQSIYTNQVCRQSTAYGLSAGRVRGQAGFAQGLPGSTTWSLLAQDPL